VSVTFLSGILPEPKVLFWQPLTARKIEKHNVKIRKFILQQPKCDNTLLKSIGKTLEKQIKITLIKLLSS
jgi:hypothetical protein